MDGGSGGEVAQALQLLQNGFKCTGNRLAASPSAQSKVGEDKCLHNPLSMTILVGGPLSSHPRSPYKRIDSTLRKVNTYEYKSKNIAEALLQALLKHS